MNGDTDTQLAPDPETVQPPGHDEAEAAAAQKADEEAKRPEPVDFVPPKGFQPPEGAEKPGDEFDMVCSFRIGEDGKLCLTKLGEAEMPGYEEKGEDGEDGKGKKSPPPSYDGMIGGLMGARA